MPTPAFKTKRHVLSGARAPEPTADLSLATAKAQHVDRGDCQPGHAAREARRLGQPM